MKIKYTDNPWDLFPEHKHLATEMSGNEIICDVSSTGAGRVFGLWHDPSAIILLANTEAEFIGGFGPLPTDGSTLEIPAEKIDLLFEKVQNLAQLPTLEVSAPGLGPEFTAWLTQLPTGSPISDLRTANPGDGFQFGDHQLAKHPNALVFALIAPVKRPGLFDRLFSR